MDDTTEYYLIGVCVGILLTLAMFFIDYEIGFLYAQPTVAIILFASVIFSSNFLVIILNI